MTGQTQRKEPKTIELYVSPEGDDGWSGRYPKPNRKSTDGPFATVQAAQKAIRRLRRAGAVVDPVRVSLRGGTYLLTRPLVFTPADSGSRTDGVEKWVSYRAYGDEQPVLSGGRRVVNWKIEEVGHRAVWVAGLPKGSKKLPPFRQIWVNGKRRFRPRLPRKGFFRIAGLPGVKPDAHYGEGQDRFICREGDIRRWANLTDVELVILHRWLESRTRIHSFDERTGLVVMDRKTTMLPRDDHRDHRHEGTEYYVENVFEALGEPGDWYLDRNANKLYYVPMPGEEPENTEVIVPVLSEILRLDGHPERDTKMELIRFEGIAFSHTEWTCPEDSATAGPQAAHRVPGSVILRNAHDCELRNCIISHVGTYGLELIDGCTDIGLLGCNISDLGGGGVKIWHGCRRNTVSDCEIGRGGRLFHSAVGVLVGRSSGNKILHNHVHDFFYTGVSVGWSWGYREGDAYGNIVEYNHIHDIGQGYLSDMGGIYTLGVSPGTRLRFNVLHDINCRGYGGFGIYTDEGSTDILIEGNLTYRVNGAPFHQHYGKENVIQNNIFALGIEGSVERTRIEPHDSFVFRHNIVYLEEGLALGRNWQEPRAVFERNLYFDPGRKRLDFGGRTFRQWQALGMDAGSRIADPKFVDPARGDFRLRDDSPALKMGFHILDFSAVGPRQAFWKPA